MGHNTGVEHRGNLTLVLWLVVIAGAGVLGCRWYVMAQRVPLEADIIAASAVQPGEPDDAKYAGNRPTQQEKADLSALDINTATAAQLKELPGIGDVLAGRIIEYRRLNGPFASTRQLTEVDGIGEKTWERLAGLVVVTPESKKAGGH